MHDKDRKLDEKEKLYILKATAGEDMQPHRNLFHVSNYQGINSTYHLLLLETNGKLDTLSDLQQTRESSEVSIENKCLFQLKRWH